ncbi:uncharacterized protein LOC128388045 [Panonychus citri]|uniref:uncharacterized protein LOC128388045 n=1 Tax=Panonychus citri TaxID=50023 RepID=UPI00230795B2|nr:uncharacterized protein LOC128388045 [Panonychus citri]
MSLESNSDHSLIDFHSIVDYDFPSNSKPITSSTKSLTCDIIYDKISNNVNLNTIDQLHNVNKINIDSLINHRRASEKPGYYCGLCKKNGESAEFYRSHCLRDSHGNLTCPVLFNHVCEVCGATGPFSHTRSYCPMVRRLLEERPKDPAVASFCINYSLSRSRNEDRVSRRSGDKFRRQPVPRKPSKSLY